MWRSLRLRRCRRRLRRRRLRRHRPRRRRPRTLIPEPSSCSSRDKGRARKGSSPAIDETGTAGDEILRIGSPAVPASYRVRDREAVDLEQFLHDALWVKTLLVGLACLVTVILVPLRVALDIGNGEPERNWIARAEQHAVDSWGN